MPTELIQSDVLDEVAARICPRCGSDEISHGYSFPPWQGIVECHADGCGAIVIAKSEREAINVWNSGEWDFRPIEWDDFGNPCDYEQSKCALARLRSAREVK